MSAERPFVLVTTSLGVPGETEGVGSEGIAVVLGEKRFVARPGNRGVDGCSKLEVSVADAVAETVPAVSSVLLAMMSSEIDEVR